jgi:hypothetical protein
MEVPMWTCLGSRFSTRVILACAAVTILSPPFVAWAQGTPPAAAPPADSTANAQPATAATAQPAPADTTKPAATPAAQPAPADSAKRAAAASAPKPAAMPDSTTAALKAEVQRLLKEMADSLQVTQEQRNALRPVLLDHAYKVNLLREKYAAMERTPANRDAMIREMQTLRDANDAKMAAVLSGDQMARFKKMRDEQLARIRPKMSSGTAKP